MTKQTKFILAIAFQAVIILAIIIFKVSVLTGGTTVMLRIAPVDPTDLLRGDYATFRYDISDVYPSYNSGIKNGDAVYVSLYQSGKYWSSSAVTKTPPAGGILFLKGRVESGGVADGTNPYDDNTGGSTLHVVYGIEQYFIPEGTGRNFSFWNKQSAAQVAVDENGNAVIKQIYVDEKPWP